MMILKENPSFRAVFGFYVGMGSSRPTVTSNDVAPHRRFSTTSECSKAGGGSHERH